MFVTFLSDFGPTDDFVGVCHGVIKRIAPEAQVIDITHGIPAQQILQGALVLANTVAYMPEGVHLAVVDPGVGTARKALALRDASGRVYVGPDNGLLIPAAEANGGVAEAFELTNPDYALPEVSMTFHGRDIFAPAAAHLALGVELVALGPPVPTGDLVRIEVPAPDIGRRSIDATVLYVDSFGNVQLNLTVGDLGHAGIEPGIGVELVLGPDRYYATAARTFADARPGDLILYVDAYRNVSVAISGGNVAELFNSHPGDRVRILLRDEE
ncbi:MAG: SAM-dependent chlorinase/fluorinase [Gaiellaceae bacterium]